MIEVKSLYKSFEDKEVLKDIRHDMTDEEVLNLLADSKISVSPESGKEKYTLGFEGMFEKQRFSIHDNISYPELR